MAPLIAILVSLVLLGAFYLLTWLETERGFRVFAISRTHLDEFVERLIFIWRNVDLAAFIREELQHLLRRLLHDLIHYSLKLVRILERLLTRLIRYFRARQATLEAPREEAREFVKTLSDFKEELSATRPEIKEIQ